MSLKCGIVGLPNVGKSTIFNALSRGNAASSNFPFCTIDPNVGIAEVKDERLIKLADMVKPQRTVFPVVEFVDIAGLVKGAHKGAGLGNMFLSYIRDVNVVVHVVRCFENENIIHTEGTINPKRDIEIVETELLLADLQSVERALEKTLKLAKSGEKKYKKKVEILESIKTKIESGNISTSCLSPEETSTARELRLLSVKPVIYVANVDESGISGNIYSSIVKEKAAEKKTGFVLLSAAVEQEIMRMKPEERKEFMRIYNITRSGLDTLAEVSYEMLGLITFFTTGPKEVRGWTIKKGTKAYEAAGIIHSDIQKGFIRAEVTQYEDYIKAHTEKEIREKGLMRLEGKEYEIKDGDVIYFRFNV